MPSMRLIGDSVEPMRRNSDAAAPRSWTEVSKWSISAIALSGIVVTHDEIADVLDMQRDRIEDRDANIGNGSGNSVQASTTA
jgi:hypothetical protein